MHSQEVATLRAWCAAGCPSDTHSLIAKSWSEAQETGAPYFRDVENPCPACRLPTSTLYYTATLRGMLCRRRSV